MKAVAYIAAGGILMFMLRPDPCASAQQLETQDSAQDEKTTSAQPVDKPSRLVWVGALVMVISQMVMLSIMTMTPVHMRAHDHSMAAVGLLMDLHVGANVATVYDHRPFVGKIRPHLMAGAAAAIFLLTLSLPPITL